MRKTKIYAYSNLLWIFVTTSTLVILFLIFRYQIASCYTEDSIVLDIFISTSPVFAVELFTDLFQGAMAGMLRGMGYQQYATITNFISYWIIMLPLSYNTNYLLNIFQSIKIHLDHRNYVWLVCLIFL